jgi:hypothetical protein
MGSPLQRMAGHTISDDFVAAYRAAQERRVSRIDERASELIDQQRRGPALVPHEALWALRWGLCRSARTRLGLGLLSVIVERHLATPAVDP